LGDQDEPHEAVGVGKEIGLGCGARAPDTPKDEHEAEEEQRRGEFPEESVPIIFAAEIDIGRTFESVFDGKAEAQKQTEVSGEAFEVRILERVQIGGGHGAVDEEVCDAVRDADTDAGTGFPATPEIEIGFRPDFVCPFPVLEEGPTDAVKKADGGNEGDVSPVAPREFVSEASQKKTEVRDGVAIVIDEAAEVWVGVEVSVLSGELLVKREEEVWEFGEQKAGEDDRAERASESSDPIAGAEWPGGSAPGEEAGTDAGPRNAGNELPEKAVGAGDGDEFAFGVVGLQSAFEEAGPLHPTAIAGDADADGESEDDPPGIVGARVSGGRVARDEPPCGSPCDAGKEASGRTAVAGGTADGPGHRAECRKEKGGEDEIVGEVASLVRGHRGTVAKGEEESREWWGVEWWWLTVCFSRVELGLNFGRRVRLSVRTRPSQG